MEENVTKPQLLISQPISMIDRPISIKAFHLPPGEQAIIRLQRQAATPSQLFHFESYAIFEANHEGVIDLETAAPIDGTYSFIDGMGLFYTQEFKKTESLLNESYSKLAPQQMVLSLELTNPDCL